MTKFSEVEEIDESLAELEGEHPATITKASLPRDPETGGFLKFKPKPGEKGYPKGICDVTFSLDDEEYVVNRRYAMSYQQNSTGAWSAWSQLLSAACGVPCGAKQQRKLGTSDLEGQWVRVVLKNVEKNGRTYLNVVNVLPPKKGSVPKPTEKFAFKPTEDEDDNPFDENQL